MAKLRLQRTTIFTGGCLAVLAGIGASRWLPAIDLTWLVAGAIVLFASYRQRKIVLFLWLLVGGFICGWWRGGEYLEQVRVYDTHYTRPVIIQGIAGSDAVYTDKGQIQFDLKNLVLLEPDEIALPGKIEVRGYGEPIVYRGDTVVVEGKLYKTLGSPRGRVSFAEIEVLSQSDSVFEDIRREFMAGTQSSLPEPHASFGLGLLVGERDTLPEGTSEQISKVGLTHLIAVSGYNLTILVKGMKRLLGKRSLYQSTLCAIVLVVSFLLITGGSASIVRASIVSMLSIMAGYYGRSFKPVFLLTLTAAITAMWSPLYLWSDIGWYLSFLAFFGILVIAPLIAKRLYRRREPKLVGQMIIESMCAWAMTAPFILYIFKEVSWVALFANILVLPFIPFAMLFAFLAGVSGIFAPGLAGWVAWPANVVLTYILDVVSILSRFPHVIVNYQMPLWLLICSYIVVIFICVVLWTKTHATKSTSYEMI